MTTINRARDSLSPDNDPHSLDALIRNLRSYLGYSSGISSYEVQVEKLKALLANYKPHKDDWKKYGQADPSKAYVRLLVDSINGRSNLLFLVWNPRRKSPIHDHADSHCVMKIIQGSLQEVVYQNPTLTGNPADMKVKKSTHYQKDEIAYISDDIGLHEVINNDPDDVAISLHLYTPPNAADYGYNIFDPKTGRCSHVAGAKTQNVRQTQLKA
ncbi:cysteine dioxygenase [Myriangium duriaei CBS 260.36]|uniref:Cysteine dioxygenase n=1 Tax=Myriangium duriaei CBS 260.36 TaxID=1168546 RepID=A0A9P4MLC1_9PEZI|nr:cysteine dioxygenase [Myriangium duriaei CBS 260.36]